MENRVDEIQKEIKRKNGGRKSSIELSNQKLGKNRQDNDLEYG